MKKLLLTSMVILLNCGFALAEGPFRIDCDITHGGNSAKSLNQLQYVEHYLAYGELYKSHVFVTVQTGDSTIPKLNLRFNEAQATLEDDDFVLIGFKAGAYNKVTLGDLANGIQLTLSTYGNVARVFCKAI